eukprot:CAMPEP_0178816726 /NCGR_PEP_ID=MMETSP0746-20121128/1504_1 /TAXON_ID=913974 /ORGANISM="Nitzschia punctata, Strain CCMP561" /LENGTH=167 /DNA_ID=CAMNT_0020477767 /DNA_START=18 /DNA_END=521 /DNA_ORIENTATION=+
MVTLAVIPEFSTMCINAVDAFESLNTFKGSMFESLICNESTWNIDSRDEGVEVQIENCRTCEEEATSSRQGSNQRQSRHIKMDSFTTFLPYDDSDIFRTRQASMGSDSQCFRMCRLHRCTAFSQDSVGETTSVHPLKRDQTASNEEPEVRMVHWDQLVEDAVNVKAD